MYELASDIVSPLPAMLVCLAAFVVLAIRRPSRGARVGLICSVAGIVLAASPVVAHVAIRSLEAEYPRRTAVPDVQAMVVLAGGIRTPGDRLTDAELRPDSITRTVCAAALARRDPVPLVVLSGGRVDPDQTGPTPAVLMRELIEALGVPSASLRTETRSRTTFENASETWRLLQSLGVRRIVLVTDAFHLPRAVRVFEAQGFEVTPWGCNYRAGDFPLDPLDWLPSASAAQALHAAVHEWVGLLWYWITGRLG